jgi:hypothetical protein
MAFAAARVAMIRPVFAMWVGVGRRGSAWVGVVGPKQSQHRSCGYITRSVLRLLRPHGNVATQRGNAVIDARIVDTTAAETA